MSSVYLGGYNAAAIKPPSQIQVLAMNASSAGGRLQALFQIRLNSSAAAVGQSPTSYIYAVGKLDQAGTIQKHDDTQVAPSHLTAEASMPSFKLLIVPSAYKMRIVSSAQVRPWSV